MKHSKSLILIALLFSEIASADVESLYQVFPDLVNGRQIAGTVNLGINDDTLRFSQTSNVSVYFISEGAGYKNQFGWYDTATDPTLDGNSNMIWENASALYSGGLLQNGSSFDLGTIEAGTEIGFFLKANGYNNPDGYTYYTDDSLNPDGITHVVAGILPELGLLTLGFEDLFGGGDLDFDDVVFAIDIGVANATAMAAAAPEPEVWLMIMLGLVGIWYKRVGQPVSVA